MKTNTKPQGLNFTELLQEAFMLRGIGLMNKQISNAMGNTTEGAVEKLLERVLPFFQLEKGERNMELALSKAWETKLFPLLIEKFRHKHREHIERFEKKKLTMPVINLPKWKPQK